MIHTIQLRRLLSKKEYEAIRTDEQYEIKYQKGKGYFTNKYEDRGINEVKLTKCSPSGMTFYYMDIIINLHLFMNAEDISDEDINLYRNTPLQGNLISHTHIYVIYAELLKLFPMLNCSELVWENIDNVTDTPKWEAVEKWKKDNHFAFSLIEMDYTYDIPLPYVGNYMKLLNYGHQPERIGRIRHEHKEGEDNLYEVNGSIKVNTYDKERELMERFGDEDNAKRHQVLRVEIALKKKKLANMVYQDQFPELGERTLFDFVDVDLAHEMVTRYMVQRCYRGDYYDYKTALEMIDSNNQIKTNMKVKLKQVIEGVQYYHGVDKYIEHACSAGKRKETIKEHIKRLEELGINPVTISRRDKDAFPLPNGGRWLPSIFTIIDKIHDMEKDNKEHPERVFELMGFSGFETISSEE